MIVHLINPAFFVKYILFYYSIDYDDNHDFDLQVKWAKDFRYEYFIYFEYSFEYYLPLPFAYSFFIYFHSF